MKVDRKIHQAWHDMQQRCYNSKNGRHARYGARGITVCDEWRSNYDSFREWSLENGFAAELSIDRIDNDGNYEPNNCRWATAAQQAASRSLTRRITFRGETLPLPEWAQRAGISGDILWRRLYVDGWDFERAITARPQSKQKIAHIPAGERRVGPTAETERQAAFCLSQSGVGYYGVARALGRSADWARRLLDPEYRATMNERSAARMREKYQPRNVRDHRKHGVV